MTRAAPDVEEVLSERALSQWAQAISYVAGHYRVACSPGSIQANAPWFRGKSRTTALTQLARQAGLSFHAPDIDKTAFSQGDCRWLSSSGTGSYWSSSMLMAKMR